MAIEEALRDFLLDDAGISGYLGVRVYPVKLVQAPTYPAALYQLISGHDMRALEKSTRNRWRRFQIKVYDTSYDTAKTIMDRIEARLRDSERQWSGYLVKSVVLENIMDAYAEDAEVHGRQLDAQILYEEPI